MPLIFVGGGQYGGEGKGLISTAISYWDNQDILVKTGGPNSAHTYKLLGKIHTYRMIPSASTFGNNSIVFPAGSLIYPAQLKKELGLAKFKGKVIIDPNAGLIEYSHIKTQESDVFYQYGGSTLTGTGAASAARSLRRLSLVKESGLDKEITDSYNVEITNSQEYLASQYREGKKILVEGSQGFGLSNYHGNYPFVSSRDNTVNGLMAQVGLGPNFIDTIYFSN